MNNDYPTDIKYKYGKGEIIVSDNKGGISFYSHDDNRPELKFFPSYKKQIHKFIYDSKSNLLFSLVGNETISIHYIPDKWPSEYLRKNTEKNNYSIVENLTLNSDNMTILKNSLSQLSFDDLNDVGSNIQNKIDLSDTTKTSALSENTGLIIDDKINEENDDEDKEVSIDSSIDGWEIYRF